MAEEVKELFDDEMKITTEVTKETQKVQDDETGSSILTGSQTVFLNSLGTILFEYPPIGLIMKADGVQAKFKAEHLRKGDILTMAQLKAIYSRPLTIPDVNGKDVVIGSGEWTDADEDKITSIIEEIRDLQKEFASFKEEVEELELKIIKLPTTSKGKSKKSSIVKRKEAGIDASYKIYTQIYKKRLELLELQTTQELLFVDSLEEQARIEKIKIFAPHCIKLIKGDATPIVLWKAVENMEEESSFDMRRIISMFAMFLKGSDISFFGDTPGGQTTS